MNFAKILRTPFLTEHLQWLLFSKIKFPFLTRQGTGANISNSKFWNMDFSAINGTFKVGYSK